MLFADTYQTIQAPAQGEYREKGSRFLGFAFPVKNEEEVKAVLHQLKKEHFQASHHCYAFRLGPDRSRYRFSDDREPSGTAGKPILNQLLSANLTDVLIVVVRYFGGSLLGVPGLILAYKTAAADALVHATVVQKFILEKYRLIFGFEIMNEVMGLLKQYNVGIIRQESDENCTIEFEIRKNHADELIGKIKKIYQAIIPPEITFIT